MMSRNGFWTVVPMLALLFPWALQAQDPDPEERDPYPAGLYAELTTPKGLIVLSLDFKRTPMTVAHFVGLAEGAIRNQAIADGEPFYTNSRFHRVAPGHVIQGGIPSSEVASTPGYSLPNEIHPELSHGREGMVGMANGGPHTGKCQFYITLGDRSYLDGDYTVFGEVYHGMDVVRSIAPDDPIETVRIVRVGREAGEFRPTTETARRLRREAWQRVRAEEAAQLEQDLATLQGAWPDAVATDAGWSYQVLEEGNGEVPAPGDTLIVRYTGRTVRGMAFSSSPETGRPRFFPPGEDSGREFPLVVGEKKVNQGFDQAVVGMKRGERRMVIVPAALAYDPIGFYGREQPGQPRFVISPNSILVYFVEVLER